MPLKRDEQIRIDNYKSQYNSVMGRIRDANKELEESLLKKQDADSGLQKIIDTLKEKEESINILIKTEQRINEKESSFKKREDAISLAEKDFIERKTLMEIKLKEEKILLSNKIRVEKDLLIITLKDKDILNKTINGLDKKLKMLYNSIDKVNKEKRIFDEELVSIQNDILFEKTKQEKLTYSHEKELQKIVKTLTEEKNKIGEADKSIKEKEKVISRKERDIRIITDRMRKMYKKLYPNLEFNI